MTTDGEHATDSARAREGKHPNWHEPRHGRILLRMSEPVVTDAAICEAMLHRPGGR
jgi:hypothetical protein